MASTRIPKLLYLAVAGLALSHSTNAIRLFHKRNDQAPKPLDQTGYTVPVTNGYMALPDPSSGLTLKVIGLGRGVITYTCDKADDKTTPLETSATADIYDANPLIQYLPNEDYLHDLPTYLLDYDYTALKNSSLDLIGHHYYSDGKLVFDLGSTGYFEGDMKDMIDSPSKDKGAIDWAFLTSTEPNSTIKDVYRVFTAGGSPPQNCKDQKQPITESYAAEYWFYEQ